MDLAVPLFDIETFQFFSTSDHPTSMLESIGRSKKNLQMTSPPTLEYARSFLAMLLGFVNLMIQFFSG